MALQATATHWTTKDADTGELRLIAVTDMSTSHLLRWVRLFRGKYLSRWMERTQCMDPDQFPSAHTLDVALRQTMPTAPAIYNALRDRGIDLYVDPAQNLDDALQAVTTPPTTMTVTGHIPGALGPITITYPNGAQVTYADPPQMDPGLPDVYPPMGGETPKMRKRRLAREAREQTEQRKALAKLAVAPVSGRRKIRVT